MTRTTTSRSRMAATYAPGTVRARRWHGEGDVRGYRPPPRLDSLRRPDRLASHHGPRLAACRVVDHRNQGITSSTGPKPFRLGPVVEDPGAAVAAPGSSVQSKIATSPPSTRRRRGGRASALHAVQPSAPAGAGKVSMAPRRNARGLWGYAPACCGRLCQSVPSSTLAVRACTSRRTVHRHAARLRYGASTPRLNHVVAICGEERSRSSLGYWPCPRQGAGR